MGAIFIKLLNMSVTAGWLILVVLCVRLLFRKIPKWATCLLWGVVAIRLIFPFSIESEFSLQPCAEPIKSDTIIAGEVVPYVPSVDSNLAIVENMVNPILANAFAYQESESASPIQVFTEIAGNVWLCGMVVLLVFAAMSMVRLRFHVRESVLYKENVYICDTVTSPFILGIIKPGIYLSSVLSEEEMSYIIAHEKAHLKRKDHLWKPFSYLLLCVYWFNPLCWIAYIILCKDIELACDEKVIKDMSFGDKKEYCRVLLSCASQRRLVLVCPLAFGEVGVKERVKSVLNYKRPAFLITIVAIVVCVIVAICFLTNPQKEYKIKITIPAGSTEDIIYPEDFFYSDEEISPVGKKIIISLGEGMGDTEVVLKPIEVKEENAYEPTYIKSGMPLKMDVEKGAWFKIGVCVQNPTTEDIDVYITIRNVEVRIASVEEEHDNIENLQETEQEHTVDSESQSQEPDMGSEDSAVREDYYEVATSISASEVEKFALSIKEDVLSQDWVSLSEKIAYPISINGFTLNERSDFMKLDFDGKLSQEFVKEIGLESCREMFCNWQGIMMGTTGQIWLSSVDEGSGTWELKIIGINGMLDESEEIASKIAGIVITNGNTGEQKTLTGEEAYSEEYYFYNDLRKLYGQLDFMAQTVENERVGYQYSMVLLDADGNKLQRVTPYKDGLTVDSVFYQYDSTGEGATASLRLMEYMEYIFFRSNHQ